MDQNIVTQLNNIEQVHPISDALRVDFYPATHFLYEWEDHWFNLPGAEALRVGQTWLKPEVDTWFRVRFENHVGLTALQPYAAGHALASPVNLMVLSKKFPSLEAHNVFFQSLLEDLFARSLHLPFTVRGPTAQNVTEALRPPTPLFTLHFLCQHRHTLRAALSIIQAFPHRLLRDDFQYVSIAEADRVDADVIIDMLHSSERWARTRAQVLVARQMRGYAPTSIRQRHAEESLDTPENRFVKHFLHQILVAAETLPAQSWWSNVSEERRQLVRQTTTEVRQALTHPMFAEVGALHQLPFNSQVLLRREGYQDMLALWRWFQQARRPLFAALHHAIEIRDIALLYEIWAYFALINGIAEVLGLDTPPVVDLCQITEEQGLRWGATADFGDQRALVYNQTFNPPTSYALTLRPDFAWMRDGRPEIVFDAKFRLRFLSVGKDDFPPSAAAKNKDLAIMHAYRDALKLRAAVVVYPGAESRFYTTEQTSKGAASLNDLINTHVSGIGALPFTPGRT